MKRLLPSVITTRRAAMTLKEAGVMMVDKTRDEMSETGIGRMWRGWTNHDQADGYEAVFRNVVLPELRDVEGCRGAYLLRRDDANGAEFVTLTLFDSLDAVRAFAGEQYETAVISDEARAVLRDFDATAQHFTVIVAPNNPQSR